MVVPVEGTITSQISRHSSHEGGKVVTRTHRPPLPSGISWYSFLEAESTPVTWMLRKKSPLTRPGIDPGTFRLIARRLNHYCNVIIKLIISEDWRDMNHVCDKLSIC